MRKVIVRVYDTKSKQWVDGVPGSFHCWGCAYEELRDGIGNYTMAIVELPGGRIITALPEDVQFVE
jgi:hypothetical protein